MRPCEDVGAMVCSMVAGHEGDLGPRSVQPQVPHDVSVSVYPMMSSVTATGHWRGPVRTIAPGDAFLPCCHLIIALNTPKRRIKQTESRKKVRHMHGLDSRCIKHLCRGGEHACEL